MEKKNYYNGDHSIFDETINVETVKQVHSRRMEDDRMSNGGRRASRMSESDHHSRRIREDRLGDPRASREPRQRRPKKEKQIKYNKNGKPKWSIKKKILVGILSLLLILVLAIGAVLGVYIVKSDGNVVQAVLNAATDVVGKKDPVFVLILGVSEDISVELTDTIILCGYNPETQNAFMLSIPRDTYYGTHPESASGFNKINALFRKSAQTTIEAVENLTGIKIDYYVVIRNISISAIFQYIGNIDFDVPINMNYDDPTQDLHIHLKKGYQTLTPDQVEQLLRFRHNNDGSSYPSSYGDNDYGRMKTQREFIKAVIEQMTSLGNVSKLKDIVSMIYPNVQTNMSGFEVLEYVPYGLQINTQGIKSAQLPGSGAMINSLSFYKANKSKTQDLVDDLIDHLGMTEKEKAKHYAGKNNITDFVTPQTTTVAKDEEGVEHNYVLISDTATCEKGGIATYECADCGDVMTQESKPLGHKYDDNDQCIRCLKYKPGSEPTANVVNNTTTTEPEENTSQDTNTTTHTHSWVLDPNSGTAATCTTTGSKVYKCSDCTETKTESIPALGHDYSVFQSTEVNATCTAAGSSTYKCSRCESTTTKAYPAATGHSYANGTCTVCGTPDPNYTPPEQPPEEPPVNNDEQP